MFLSTSVINYRHKCKNNWYFWMQRVSTQYLLNWVCILFYASNLGTVCPPARDVLVSTIPADWGTETRAITWPLASKCPLVISVPNPCCHVSACKPRLFQVPQSWGWKPNILFSLIFGPDQLLSMFLLSTLLAQFDCEFDELSKHSM